MAPQQKSALNIVMGAMTFGEEGKEGARVHNLKDVEAILDMFQAHGHTRYGAIVIGSSALLNMRWFLVDTARYYSGGTSESSSAKLMDPDETLRYDIRKHVETSLKALNADQLELWYLHGPDRTTPYEVTLKAVNELYKEGKFRRFGISNYMACVLSSVLSSDSTCAQR
ncbi:NADP-dependent oxidoreductase domain-containing protein [Fomitopsis serialis]|uniref:NADP-dependent oxidoreductase domain-containing protein n=1 Tax=Fomitopsis serialis TaxID=139415 RepID=UPI002008E3EF|nr:NADP-dependent oxidoreductase domain-containing protein [Neoantrodia serialis]KAH9919020.1 NADP-dependent oxidoreductase domain-containing protein [Neoantrodia serialis]